MGYFKNKLIEQQVELGDRIPAPRPATSHLAYPSRRDVRQRRQIAEQRVKQYQRDLNGIGAAGGLIGLVLGVPLGLLAAVIWL